MLGKAGSIYGECERIVVVISGATMWLMGVESTTEEDVLENVIKKQKTTDQV